jgi:hypothetical protein
LRIAIVFIRWGMTTVARVAVPLILALFCGGVTGGPVDARVIGTITGLSGSATVQHSDGAPASAACVAQRGL